MMSVIAALTPEQETLVRHWLPVWIALCGILLAAAVWQAVRRRRRAGRPFFRPEFRDPAFLEERCSGASSRGRMGKWGGANRCLWVVVTDGELRTGLHFPFSAVFDPRLFDPEVTVKLSDIISTETKKSALGLRKVVVQHREADGRVEELELTVKDPDGLLRALRTDAESQPPA